MEAPTRSGRQSLPALVRVLQLGRSPSVSPAPTLSGVSDEPDSGEAIDWAELHRVRRRIERLEAALVPLYRRRVDLIALMTAQMGQREVGAYWGISGPRVNILLRKAGKRRKRRGTR